MAVEMKVVGLDVAKNVFHVYGVDRRGETVLRKRLRRSQVAEFFQHQTPCLIGVEATQGAHPLAMRIIEVISNKRGQPRRHCVSYESEASADEEAGHFSRFR